MQHRDRGGPFQNDCVQIEREKILDRTQAGILSVPASAPEAMLSLCGQDILVLVVVPLYRYRFLSANLSHYQHTTERLSEDVRSPLLVH